MVNTALALGLLASVACCGAQADELKNWFDDPFFQVAGDITGCPVPLGPFMTEAERNSEAHSRIERGTSCWMAGQCKQPNAYLYDPAIARDVRALAAEDLFRGGSIWITVKRRFVWVEGCIHDARRAQAIEARLGKVPDVDRVLINLMTGTSGRPPYRVRP